LRSRVNSPGNSGLRSTSRTLHISGCGSSRAGGDADATRKLTDHAFDWLANLRRLLRAVVREVGVPERVKHGAVIKCTRVILAIYKTVVDGTLECSIVPSILEIAVEAISSGITLREDEATTVIQVRNLSDCIVRLKEQMREHIRIVGRTNSIVDLRHMGNMTVVGFVQVFTIPASLEVDLRAETIDTNARVSRHTRRLWTNRFGKTGKTDSIRDWPVGVRCISPSHA
jgi:hypothetical protein